jgi:hypothetical protein
MLREVSCFADAGSAFVPLGAGHDVLAPEAVEYTSLALVRQAGHLACIVRRNSNMPTNGMPKNSVSDGFWPSSRTAVSRSVRYGQRAYLDLTLSVLLYFLLIH